MKTLTKELKEVQKQYTKKQERARAFSLKLELGGKLKVVNTALECKTVEEVVAALNTLKEEAEAEIKKPVKQMGDVDVKCRFFGMKEEAERILEEVNK